MKVLLSAVILAVLATATPADSIWDYAGVVMNGQAESSSQPGCNCALTGQVILTDTFAPVSWSFTDGTHTLNQTDSTITVFPFYTGNSSASDPFTRWLVQISGGGVFMQTARFADPSNYVDEVNVDGQAWAFGQGQSGSWIDPAIPTPESGTSSLLAVGLLLLAITVVPARRSLA